MPIAFAYRVADTGSKGVDMLMRVLLENQNNGVKIGIHGEEVGQNHPDKGGSTGPLTVGQIAEIHEFGLGYCPRRSFIRSWADSNRERNVGIMKSQMQWAVKNRDHEGIHLKRIGAMFVGDCQKRIMSSMITPELSDYTIAKKGSSIPLLDTGVLKSAIRYSIVHKGSEIMGPNNAQRVAAAKQAREEKREAKAPNRARLAATKEKIREAKKAKKAAAKSRKRTAKAIKRTTKKTVRAIRKPVRAVKRTAKRLAKKLTRKLTGKRKGARKTRKVSK